MSLRCRAAAVVLAVTGGLLLTACGDDPQASAGDRREELCAGLVDLGENDYSHEDQLARVRELAENAPDDLRAALEAYADARETQWESGAGSMTDEGEAAGDEVEAYIEDTCESVPN